MGILSWLKQGGSEVSPQERMQIYGLRLHSDLPWNTLTLCADLAGKLAQGKLRWFNKATKEEKDFVIKWARVVSMDFEAELSEGREFYGLQQLPCSKEGAELALLLLVLVKAMEGDQQGEAAAYVNYMLLASFVDMVGATAAAARLESAAPGSAPDIWEGFRQIRQVEQARLTAKFQDFISSR